MLVPVFVVFDVETVFLYPRAMSFGVLRVIFFFILFWFLYQGCWFAIYGISKSKLIQYHKGLFMELRSKLFGSYFQVSFFCSLPYHHLLC
jgi:hypothetical protein